MAWVVKYEIFSVLSYIVAGSMSNETRTSSAHVSAFLSLPAEPHSVCLCAPVLSVFNCQCHLESPGNGVSVDGMQIGLWPCVLEDYFVDT